MKNSDPYTNAWACVSRLINDYKKYGNIVVAFDFDNTIYDFHSKGFVFDAVVEEIRRAQQMGISTFCWTGTTDHGLVRKECAKLGIVADNINKSSVSWEGSKPMYSLLLDDRAGLQSSLRTLKTFLNWLETQKN